ncbi:MAG TPA: PepSY-associated TM helix domain-containing protein [Longimicrobiales bacterium]
MIFWMHLTTGLTIGAVVLTMAGTGVLLTYQRQIQARADTRGLEGGPPHAGAQLLPPDAIAGAVRGVTDAMITGIRWRREADAPVEVELGRERMLFVNAYTGAVLGAGSARTHAFFRGVTDVHRWLALNDKQSIGRAITGAANLAFLFMVLSGSYLWWPRRPTARGFRNVMMFRRGLRAKARDFNWHNVIGFWSLAPLAVIIFSAVVISYAWAGGLVERAAVEVRDSASPPSERRAPPVEPGRELERGVVLLTRARSHVDDWRSITLQLPVRSGVARFLIDSGTGGQPQKQGELALAAATGEVIEWMPFASGPRAGRVRSILRYLHTGEVLGIAGQTIAGVVSAGAVLLVWTGASLALRRFGAWRRRDGRPPARAVGSVEPADAAPDFSSG